MSSSLNFVFFGCWNDDSYEVRRTSGNKAVVPRDVVLDSVYNVIKPKNSIHALIVAGDNIYGAKEQAHNVVSTKYYKSTLNVLSKENHAFYKSAPIKLFALGNHNIEDKTVYNAVTHKLQNFYNRRFGYQNLFPHFYSYTVSYPDNSNKVLIIVIDTNIFDDITNPTMLSHYSRIFGCHYNNDILKTQHDILTIGKQILQDMIIKRDDLNMINHICIVGHHPLYFINPKEKRNKEMNQQKEQNGFTRRIQPGLHKSKDLIETIHNISQIAKNINNDISYSYLCADVHNFQSFNITFTKYNEILKTNETLTLQHIISGTAGAKPDVFDDHVMEYFNKMDRHVFQMDGFKVALEKITIMNSYGYSLLSIKSDGVMSPKYIYVPMDDTYEYDITKQHKNEKKEYMANHVIFEKKKIKK